METAPRKVWCWPITIKVTSKSKAHSTTRDSKRYALPSTSWFTWDEFQADLKDVATDWAELLATPLIRSAFGGKQHEGSTIRKRRVSAIARIRETEKARWAKWRKAHKKK